MMTEKSSYKVIQPSLDGYGVLGHIVHLVPGWYFYSEVQGHANSRKPKATAEEAIPHWATKRGAKLA